MYVKRIDVKVGFGCNNCCLFCVQDKKKKDSRDKTTPEIKEILRGSVGQAREVVFTGGETTVRPDLVDLVAFAKSLGYRIQIQSNGRMFAYKNFCRDIIAAGAEIFAISIHGHKAQLHDFLTGRQGSFEQTVQGIRHLIAYGKAVLTNTVINSYNYKLLPDIAEFLVDLGVLKYKLSYPHILGSALVNKDAVVVKKTKAMPYVKKALKVGLASKTIPVTEAIPFCFLRGLWQCAEEKLPETKVFELGVLESFNTWRRQEGRIKGPRCKECLKDASCEGPWREYPFYFGWKEFIPIKRF